MYETWTKARLIERIKELEVAAGQRTPDPIEYIAAALRVPMAQAKIIAELASGEVRTRSHLFLSIYKDVLERPSQRAIDNHINRIRDRLAIFGVVLNSSRGEGISIENPDFIQAVMAGASTASWFPNGVPQISRLGSRRDELVREAVMRRLDVAEPAKIESHEIRKESGLVGDVATVMDRLHSAKIFRIVRRPTRGRRHTAWVIRRVEA